MAVQAVVHDFQPPCLRGAVDLHSVLTLPLGRGYLLNYVADALAAVDCRDVSIVPAFEPDLTYEERLGEIASDMNLTIVTSDRRAEHFLDGEPSDTFIFLDPRYWPVNQHEIANLLAVHFEHFGAVFGARAGCGSDGKVERVILDTGGNVRLIQRVFDRMAWSHADATVVPSCVLPHGLTLHGLQFPLSVVRRRLAARGVPLRDLPTGAGELDLGRSEDLLRLACSYALQPPDKAAGEACHQSSGRHFGISVAQRGTVAQTARIVGDVLVNPGAHIAEGATVIGPAVIGRGATVGLGATVAHSLILDRCSVKSGDSIHQTVFCGGRLHEPCEPESDTIAQPPPPQNDHFTLIADGKGQHRTAAHQRRGLLRVKRVIDVIVATAGLLVLSPLMLLVAGVIKLTSPGPVFFVHRREGVGGREFGCIKFRTMRTDAHRMQKALAQQNEADGRQFVIKQDPRTTSLGNFLRKSNIDELPQLWNVLLGQMSLVGPRPSPFRENQVCAPWRQARLSVPPGVTGLWQVCRHNRQDGDFHQWIHYDVAYVRNISLWLDVKIIWFTFWSLGGRRSIALERIVNHPVLDQEPSSAEEVPCASGTTLAETTPHTNSESI